jgi:hypothetical protein
VRNHRRYALIFLIPLAFAVCLGGSFGIGVAVGGGRPKPTPTRSPAAVLWRHGIPVGVQNSRAGALAFADAYLSLGQTTMEANPAVFSQLVSVDDSPEFRSTHVSAVESLRSAHRASIQAWSKGARGVWLMAAHRLERFTGQTAQMTAWNGGIAWGGGFQPQQNWAMTTVAMRWNGYQWLVSSIADRPDAAPIPSATPQATARNTRPGWFTAQLAGFTTVAVQ